MNTISAAETMPGWVRLRYDYASGYAAAEALKGESEIVVVEDGEGRVAGCGTRSTRWLYLDGAPRRVGYLSGFRSFAGARGGFGVFRGFAKIHELERANPDELTFMTVLDGNPAGRALLTSGRVGLPECRPRGFREEVDERYRKKDDQLLEGLPEPGVGIPHELHPEA